jgi:hypothetical protein
VILNFKRKCLKEAKMIEETIKKQVIKVQDKIRADIERAHKEEERKRRKKICRRFRNIIEKCCKKNEQQLNNKLTWLKNWNTFISLKKEIGSTIKEKLSEKSKVALARNRCLFSIINIGAKKISNWFEAKKKTVRLNADLNSSISQMIYSVQETKDVMKQEENYEKTFSSYTEESIKISEKYVKQFEEDNLFYFDKKTWKKLTY